MDFIADAQFLIPELTGLTVTVWEEALGTQLLNEFEERFCFLPNVQTLYTAHGLLSFFEKKNDSHVYVAADLLDTHMIIIKANAKWILLGPYVISAWQEKTAHILLAKCGVQKSALLPYKYYYCSLPLLEQSYTIRIAMLLLMRTKGNVPPHELKAIDVMAEENAILRTRMAYLYEEPEMVNRRYEWERKFMETIRQGQTEEAVELLKREPSGNTGLRFITEDMKDQIAGMAVLRTMARLAARSAGLTPILIDSISQEYAQKMHHALDKQQLNELMDEYVRTFCHMIRVHSQNSYSPYVRRAVQYIDAHLSQPITIDDLCRLSNISRSHFVRLFGQETGKTVKQYIAQARCECAANLLENSQMLVQEVSHYVGYDDTNYFARVFKEIMGISPQEYRKKKSFY